MSDYEGRARLVVKHGKGARLTGKGCVPAQPGWAWVAAEAAGAKAGETRVTFRAAGEVTVRIQAGMEGVGFDQLVLSPARFLDKAPTDTVVAR